MSHRVACAANPVPAVTGDGRRRARAARPGGCRGRRRRHGRGRRRPAPALRDAVGSGVDALVVVGGDGMVNLGVNPVAGTGTPLGIVAAGTGNDIARELGLPIDDARRGRRAWSAHSPAAACARSTRPAACSVGREEPLVRRRARRPASTPWSTSGPTAGVAARPRQVHLAIARELPVFRPRHYELELDGQRGRGRRHARRGRQRAGVRRWHAGLPGRRARRRPARRHGRGPDLEARVPADLPEVYSGAHVDHPGVQIHRAASVRLDALPAPTAIVAYADGERFGPLPLTCEAVPGALHAAGLTVAATPTR